MTLQRLVLQWIEALSASVFQKAARNNTHVLDTDIHLPLIAQTSAVIIEGRAQIHQRRMG